MVFIGIPLWWRRCSRLLDSTRVEIEEAAAEPCAQSAGTTVFRRDLPSLIPAL